MKANLIKLLETFSEVELRELVMSVYGMDKQVDKRIEAALLASDSTALGKHLKKQVQSLNRGSRFISYGESFQFSRTLDQLIGQINTLLPNEPKIAFELADLFMASHVKVYSRCDDSGGSVGDSYRDALRLWLQAAEAWDKGEQPCKLDWSAEILKRHNDNGYAVWDYLISGSLGLLGEDALREMAWSFEADIKRLSTSKADGLYNPELSRAELGLKAVAEALGDVAMYERSYMGSRAEPNELQKEQIVKFCLLQKDGESALKWLAGLWEPIFADRRQKLLDETLTMLGHDKELLELRREAYRVEPSFEKLQKLLLVVDEAEREQLQEAAVSRASASDDIIVAVEALIKLQDMDAVSAYVLQHPEKLELVGYYTLADWVVKLEQEGKALAAVLVYRVLLLDILQAGRTKAYRHAAKYFRALQVLDANLVGYHSLISKDEFDQQLQKKHGKKSSFWSLVG